MEGVLFCCQTAIIAGVAGRLSAAGRFLGRCRAGRRATAAGLVAAVVIGIFGWIGSFILGIGFYSLSKMGALPRFAVSRSWISWTCWTTGVLLRWQRTSGRGSGDGCCRSPLFLNWLDSCFSS